MLDAIRATGGAGARGPGPRRRPAPPRRGGGRRPARCRRMAGAGQSRWPSCTRRRRSPMAGSCDHAFSDCRDREYARSDDWPAFWGATAHRHPRLRTSKPDARHAGSSDIASQAARLCCRGGRPRCCSCMAICGAATSSSAADGGGHAHRPRLLLTGTARSTSPCSHYSIRRRPASSTRSALDAGWRDRLPLYRLWPLLVHLRLFGRAYRAQVEAALVAARCLIPAA